MVSKKHSNAVGTCKMARPLALHNCSVHTAIRRNAHWLEAARNRRHDDHLCNVPLDAITRACPFLVIWCLTKYVRIMQ